MDEQPVQADANVPATPNDTPDVTPNDASNDTPVPAPADPVVTSQPADDSAPTDAPVEAPADPEPAVEEEVEEYQEFKAPPVPQFDLSQVPVDAEGNADLNSIVGAINQNNAAIAQSARQQAQIEYQEQRQEEKLWEKAIEKFPDLKGNKDMREMIANARYGDALQAIERGDANFKFKTPSQVAERLYKQLGVAKTEGVKQATQSVRVQQSAQLETASTARNVSPQDDLLSKISSRDPIEAEKAQKDLLKSAIDWSKIL